MTRKDIALASKSILDAQGILVNFFNAKFEVQDDIYGQIAQRTKEDLILKACCPNFVFGKDYSLLDFNNRVLNLVVCENPGDLITSTNLYNAFEDAKEQIKSNHIQCLHIPYLAIADSSFLYVLLEAFRDLDLSIILYGMPNFLNDKGYSNKEDWEFITGLFPHYHYVGTQDDVTITKLPDKDLTDLSSLFSQFKGASISINGCINDKVEFMDDFFLDSTNLKQVKFSNNDFSGVTSLACAFAGGTALKSVEGIPVNTKSCKDFGLMFADCRELTKVSLAGLDLSAGNYFDGMFKGCTRLEEVDFTGCKVKEGACLDNMFAGCDQLHSVITDDPAILAAWEDTKASMATMSLF